MGDLERLQDIQKKRDVTNRDWQRIILRNIAKALVEEDSNGPVTSTSLPVFETRQLWWQLHTKMRELEYQNMLLLVRMKDHLEDLLFSPTATYFGILIPSF